MEKKTNHRCLKYVIAGGPASAIEADGDINVPAGRWLRLDLVSGGWWYGHGFAHRQPYPLNRETIVNDAFAVNNAQSPIWMCSAGFAALAQTTAPLCVRINADNSGTLDVMCPVADLPVCIFAGQDLPEAHRKLMRALHWPNAAPDRALLADPIFCTWTQYPRCITQRRIVEMAQAIRDRGFPCSTITIDDRWESVFGELEFSGDFADPPAMVRRLHELGFRVLLWVTPFVNQEARTFEPLSSRGFLVPRKDGRGAALLKWWGGTAGLVDLTNPQARLWYRKQLVRLRDEIGIDGFKIDGGDAKYQPAADAAQWHKYKGPSGYADELLALFDEVAPGRCETRTMWLSQNRNIMWRQGGKDSHWGVDNGLTAMVHLALHMSLMGYDVLMPDMIPGRVLTMTSDMPLPSDELFVRWTEASAFLPLMQFSYFPWNYCPAVADIARQYALAHQDIGDYLHAAATGRTVPLVRPLWYDWPDASEYYVIGDEFMLGPDLLVAPVLAEGVTARDIALPPGRWIDAWTAQEHAGGNTLVGHSCPCPGIGLFVRAANSELLSKLHERLRKVARGVVKSGVTTTTYRCGLDRDLSVTG